MKDYKTLYECLIYDLESNLEQAREMYKDFHENNLSINSIEAEGYLRGCLTAFNLVKYTEDMIKEIDEEADAKTALIAEKESLLERLAEIERIEKGNQH